MKEYLFRIVAICLLISCCYFVFHKEGEHDSFDSKDLADTLIDAGFNPTGVLTYSVDSDKRVIVITTDVNAHFSSHVVSRLLFLNNLSSTEPIDLYLRTEGGWEADAFAVIDTIQSIKAPVNIHGIGEVHSAGSMILASGTGDRVVYPNTILGFHSLGDDEDDIFGRRYINFWKRSANLPAEWLTRRDSEMIYFSPEKAIKHGVADILVSGEADMDKSLEVEP